MLYINQLHLVTVMLLTGKVKVTDKDGNKEVSIEGDQAPSPDLLGGRSRQDQRPDRQPM